MLATVDAVDAVVGRHHRPRPRTLHRDLEPRQVDLTQRSLIHHGVNRHPPILLVVNGEVLQGSPNALALHPSDMAPRHLPAQIGVLREILEVSATERRTLDVGPRPQHHADALSTGLSTQRCAYAADQIAVPGGSQRRGGGEASGGDALVQSRPRRGRVLFPESMGSVR